MIKLYDIIKAIRDNIKICVPAMQFYVGNIPEKPKRPSILMLVAHSKDVRSTYLTQTRLLSIQLIYFGPLNTEEKEEFTERLETTDALRPFLNQFILSVDDRVLSFEFDVGEADEHLSITLDFKFKDSIVITQQDYESIEHIFLNEEALS